MRNVESLTNQVAHHKWTISTNNKLMVIWRHTISLWRHISSLWYDLIVTSYSSDFYALKEYYWDEVSTSAFMLFKQSSLVIQFNFSVFTFFVFSSAPFIFVFIFACFFFCYLHTFSIIIICGHTAEHPNRFRNACCQNVQSAAASLIFKMVWI